MNQQERVALTGTKPVNPDAYEAYLKGRYFWNKRTEEGLRKAIEYFNLATDQDPAYAKAYTGLADAYALSGDWEYGILLPRDAFSKAKAAATKALALDDNLAEAHTSLAFILDLYAWDWGRCPKGIRACYWAIPWLRDGASLVRLASHRAGTDRRGHSRIAKSRGAGPPLANHRR